MIDLPTQIKIGAIQWHIHKDSRALQYEGLKGETLYQARTIRIDDEIPIPLQQETVLHETLHALCVPLTEDIQLSETQVRYFAAALMQVFMDNPKLRDFLFQEDDNG